MTQPWAVIIAAVSAALVAGAFALIGHRIGLKNGRLQVTDQAAVEHGQWLRGQRQTAYVEALAAWDKLIADFQETAASWRDFTQQQSVPLRQDPSLGVDELPTVSLIRRMGTITDPVLEALERVLLLGPPAGERVAAEMGQAMHGMRQAFFKALADGGRCTPVAANSKEWKEMWRLREEFFMMARDVLRTAPTPKAVT